MSKQTAIEWLERRFYFTKGQLIDIDFQKAKSIERKQMQEAQMDLFHKLNDLQYGISYLEKRDVAETFCQKYYKETFKGGEQ